MAKHFNASQLKSQLRKLEQDNRRAINDVNRKIRSFNVSYSKAVNAYNNFARQFNSAVQKNKQIISRESRKLNYSSQSTFNVSIRTMQRYHADVNSFYTEDYPVTPEQNEILDLIEAEQANSLITANTIESNDIPEENTEDKEIGDKLRIVSEDLDNRWKGALYALNPNNPDAARHFCTSAREIFTDFIEMKAPNELVIQFNPNYAKTDRGTPTRKEKIKYMMRNKQMDSSVINFADADIDNILELFHVLSDGTHGAAGRYDFSKLTQVKKRVEQGINFLCTISA